MFGSTLNCTNVASSTWSFTCFSYPCSAGSWTLISNSGLYPYSVAMQPAIVHPQGGGTPTIVAMDALERGLLFLNIPNVTDLLTINSTTSRSDGKSFSLINITNTSAMWFTKPTPASSPTWFPFYGTSAAFVPSRNTIAFFGGTLFYAETTSMWEWAVDSNSWFQDENNLPTGLYASNFVGANTIDSNISSTFAYLFNGISSLGQYASSIYSLYPIPSAINPKVVVTPKTVINLPKSRMYAATTLVNGTVTYLFGGLDPQTRLLNDLWELPYSNGISIWQQINASGAPSPRCMHSMVTQLYGGIIILLFGLLTSIYPMNVAQSNYNYTCSGDIFLFDTIQNEWVLPTVVNNLAGRPKARLGQAAVVLQSGDIFVFGGIGHLGEFFDDAWRLTFVYDGSLGTASITWVSLTQVSLLPGFSSPMRRYGHVAISWGQAIIVHGGEGPNQTILGDTWLGELQADGSTWKWMEFNFANNVSVTGHQLVVSTLFFGSSEPVLFRVGGIFFYRSSNSLGPVTFFAPIISAVKPGCPPGTSGRMGEMCTPCSLGFYKSIPGTSVCIACPVSTTTVTIGSSSMASCNVCVPKFCNGHGVCIVMNSAATCSCDPAWFGSQCSYTWPPIVVGSLLFAFLVALAFSMHRRRAVFIRYLKDQSDMNVKLLQDRDYELDQMQKAWEIHESEITLLGKVDEGAFGEVFRASFRELPVAVKRLKSHLVEMDSEVRLDYEREVKFMRTLRHKNILLFFGAGIFNNGIPFLVVEWAARGSLRKLLQDVSIPLPFDRRLSFAIGAAQGMEYLHSARRIHRDLKVFRQ